MRGYHLLRGVWRVGWHGPNAVKQKELTSPLALPLDKRSRLLSPVPPAPSFKTSTHVSENCVSALFHASTTSSMNQSSLTLFLNLNSFNCHCNPPTNSPPGNHSIQRTCRPPQEGTHPTLPQRDTRSHDTRQK